MYTYYLINKRCGEQKSLGVLSYLQLAIMAKTDLTSLCKLSSSDDTLYENVCVCRYVPVLCGVSYSSDELHSFGVVVDLNV